MNSYDDVLTSDKVFMFFFVNHIFILVQWLLVTAFMSTKVVLSLTSNCFEGCSYCASSFSVENNFLE